ncbi:histidine kinase [Nonlabens marinus]|uniref:Putative two-component system sensor protein histidine kinase n=1 Tax=Nonlabens marinus S1-08 TaxID=1454201 RepID=W8VW69_9FLAO|nr:histidine kinase [Nonlabens marinus]BAO56068.1 putative two-component system sensor protein histidine kinase [Nonlabens marinus S1-08]
MRFSSITKTILISAFIALVISLINYGFGNQPVDIYEAAQDYSINFLFAISITLVNETFFSYFNDRMSWSTAPLLRLVLGVLGSVVVTLITLFLLIAFTRMIIFGMGWQEFLDSQRQSWYLFGVGFTLVIALIFHLFYFYKQLQQSKLKEQKVIASSATAQFDALKNQLDPHFLFNSLNVLVSLIEENPSAAVNFTTSLSKVYRYVLEQRGKQLVSVQEELAFARIYIGLLKMRFEDSLEVQIPEQVSHPELQIVPLSLQLLIENAVKHNVISSSQPLHLQIYEADGQLVIKNNLQAKNVLGNSTGVGLANIASRYGLLTEQKMTIDKNRTSFQVHLPLLDPDRIQQPKTTAMETPLEDYRLMQAKERVKNIKEFYDELWRTVLILLFLAVLNYFTSDFLWVIFPAIGMGIGLFFQYMKNFDRHIFLGKNWQKNKLDELMNDQNF